MIKTFSRVPLYYYELFKLLHDHIYTESQARPSVEVLRSENFYIKVKLAPHDEAVSR